MSPSKLVSIFLLCMTLMGCALTGDREAPPLELVQERPTTAAAGSAILFNTDGSTISSPVQREARYTEPAPAEWETTESFSGGRTRISAVRHRGNATDYYTSSSGPNGSTRRLRTVSQSSNAHPGHRH